MSHYFPITDPTLIFLVVLAIILAAPIVMGKLRIPHIIGMVLAGMLVGEHGLGVLSRDASFELFGKVGLYYILFLAALEMDLEVARRSRPQIVAFGLLTFLLPSLITFAASLWLLRYSLTTSMLLGCIMASNTLIAYPIVSRYGLTRKPSVSLSVGSSMLSLLLALVMLSAVAASARQGLDVGFWLIFALRIAGCTAALLLVIPRLTRCFLRRYSDSVMQFIFVLGILFMSAAMSDALGLEGIFGAFLSGLVLSRFIPRLSPLMNRIEFIGNALFIPYFLIGVGMLINVRLLLSGSQILCVALCITVAGTLGKALAAYASSIAFRLPLSSGHMMLGLTSAHAAGAIAMVMVGRGLTVDGEPVVTETLQGGVVLMILFTCIISTIMTEQSALRIVFRDKEFARADERRSEEKILIPVKYPEYADRLVSLALLMQPERRPTPLVGLNVVYDDEHMRHRQDDGQRLLEHLTRLAAAAEVTMQTQVRIAANIANGIKHAFKEYQATEILIGMHTHPGRTNKFWGDFHQSLFNGLGRQIIMARLGQPPATLRCIQVAVPSRAQYEKGFYRWLQRLSLLAGNLECRIVFHGRADTLEMIRDYVATHHPGTRAEYHDMEHWVGLPHLATTIADDHLFVVVTARKGTVSYKSALERLPQEITTYFAGKNIMIVFPDQYGEASGEMTFAQPQHTEQLSAYDLITRWIHRKFG